MKKRTSLYLDDNLVKQATGILQISPSKSLSAWVDEKMFELIQKTSEKNHKISQIQLNEGMVLGIRQ